jgi:SPP1 gp7 family putative phage head morphogenesis protein
MSLLRRDPTRTGQIRRKFLASMKRRFGDLIKAIIQVVEKEDGFGLTPNVPNMTFNARFTFDSNPQKVAEFQLWLKEQVDAGILEVGTGVDANQPWTSEFIGSSYKKAQARAYVDMQKGMSEKRKKELLQTFGVATDRQRMELLYTRTFDGLKGISADMSAQISRILTDGLAHGLGPRELARKLVKAVSGIEKVRARRLARTEIIHAYAEGQLDAMEAAGITHVEPMVEWVTAIGACEQCGGMHAVVLTIKEARSLIPRHPNCRCAWLPANVGEDGKGQKKSPAEIKKALDASIRAGAGKKTPLGDARKRSTWPGADLKPKSKAGQKKTPATSQKKSPSKPVKPKAPSRLSKLTISQAEKGLAARGYTLIGQENYDLKAKQARYAVANPDGVVEIMTSSRIKEIVSST